MRLSFRSGNRRGKGRARGDLAAVNAMSTPKERLSSIARETGARLNCLASTAITCWNMRSSALPVAGAAGSSSSCSPSRRSAREPIWNNTARDPAEYGGHRAIVALLKLPFNAPCAADDRVPGPPIRYQTGPDPRPGGLYQKAAKETPCSSPLLVGQKPLKITVERYEGCLAKTPVGGRLGGNILYQRKK
jgi:hypothetical protein